MLVVRSGTATIGNEVLAAPSFVPSARSATHPALLSRIGNMPVTRYGWGFRHPHLKARRRFVYLSPTPEPVTNPDRLDRVDVHRRDRLGGILHEYAHAA
jgi:hypothetical protein